MIRLVFDTSGMTSTVGMILSDQAVAEVYGAFGDGCLERYGLDISNVADPFIKRNYLSTPVLRMVQSFVKQYGKENAIGIIKTLFGVAHEGAWRGEQVGKSIFMTKRRWLADELLLEHQKSVAESGKWEVVNGPIGAEKRTEKVRVQPVDAPCS